ncbi:MAG TPA: DUF6069 family protein [Acidimicrobiales bacterium]|nr:DUF6069 family protein [Acidimicrobiales bacterium]
MPSGPTLTIRLLTLLRIDLGSTPSHRQPRFSKVVLAAALSIVGSLVADALLVAIGTHAFPSTKGYSHFQFHDYATLTIIGIVIGCAAWPIVVRISTAPRWLFFRSAILVTAVLLLPDLFILHQGQPSKAVAFLMLMHIAIGVITYNLLVRLAPTHRRRSVHRERRVRSGV